jgi:hypothetical protein
MNWKRNSDALQWLAACAGNHASRGWNQYQTQVNDAARLASQAAAHSLKTVHPWA